MAAISEEQQQEIKALICDILEIEPDELSNTSRFIEDHGADSLRAIEILASLETNFGVTIDQAELSRMTTLENVYQVLDEVTARV